MELTISNALLRSLSHDESPASTQGKLRAYYDSLLPETNQKLLQVYSAGWGIDLHDPDVSYNRDGENDHNYCQNKVAEIVERSPTNADFFFSVLDAFAVGDYNSCWMTIDKIASHVSNPLELLRYLTSLEPLVAEPPKLSGFMSSVIAGARKKDRSIALKCLNEALEGKLVVPYAVNLFAATGMDDELMTRAIGLLEQGQIEPRTTTAIAFPDTLEGIAPHLIAKLLNTMGQHGTEGLWASIEFIGRMFYGNRLSKEPFFDVIKSTVSDVALFERERFSNMDWYHWHDITGKLIDEGYADPECAEEILNFILSVTDVEEYNVQLAFDEYAQKILRKLISVDPNLVWRKFHERLANPDNRREYRLNGLFEGGVGSPSSAGVLNDIPLEISVAWMLEDKTERLPFILQWVELFSGDKEDREWSATFVDFTNQHIDNLEALDAVTSRLTTGAWWGSYANKLESERERLLQLKELSSNPLVRHWVDKSVSRFDNAIVAERRRDANRDADFRK